MSLNLLISYLVLIRFKPYKNRLFAIFKNLIFFAFCAFFFTIEIIMTWSIENTGHQLGYPIGIPIWVLKEPSFIKIIDKGDKNDQ